MRDEEIAAAVEATVEAFRNAGEVQALRQQVADLNRQLELTRASLDRALRLQERIRDVAKVAQYDGELKALQLALRDGPGSRSWPEYLAERAAFLAAQRDALIAEVESR